MSDTSNPSRMHARSFVEQLLEEKNDNPFLRLGTALARAARYDSAVAAAVDRIHENVARVHIGAESDQLHERLASRWGAPLIEGMTAGPSILLASAYLRAMSLLAQRADLVTGPGFAKQVIVASETFDAMLRNEPDLFEELLAELHTQSIRDDALAAKLRDAAAELATYAPELDKLAAELAGVVRGKAPRETAKCTINGSSQSPRVCFTVAIVVIILVCLK